MVPASRERRGGGPLFHWTCRKCRSSSSIVTTRAPENTRSSNDGDGSGEGGGGSNGTEDLPHLGFLFLAHSLSLRFSLSLSLALFNPLHRVSRSTFLRCVHVGDTTTLSGRSGSLQRAPSESIPPISPPPSSSSISDQQGL